jgi:hypothetical protein
LPPTSDDSRPPAASASPAPRMPPSKLVQPQVPNAKW